MVGLVLGHCKDQTGKVDDLVVEVLIRKEFVDIVAGNYSGLAWNDYWAWTQADIVAFAGGYCLLGVALVEYGEPVHQRFDTVESMVDVAVDTSEFDTQVDLRGVVSEGGHRRSPGPFQLEQHDSIACQLESRSGSSSAAAVLDWASSVFPATAERLEWKDSETLSLKPPSLSTPPSRRESP
jgi:hypothetical protein